MACELLVGICGIPVQELNHGPPALQAQSLSHWTTCGLSSEVPEP